MLRYVETERKTYEEKMAEAVTNIPIYTDEWTNFNPSDPGMTILETLIGFATLQQDSMDDIPAVVRQKLLKMVGFEIQKGRNARLLLSAANVKQPFVIPANHKFKIGDICFETNREIPVADERLIGVYGQKSGGNPEEYHDFSFLCDRETKIPALIFGDNPKVGDSIYFVSNSLPAPGKELTYFATLQTSVGRNPFDGRTEKVFAEIEWECFTTEGWKKLDVRDNTSAFLMDGEIRMWMPMEEAEVYTKTPKAGYVIRGHLISAEYDIRPKVTSLEAFLFEVWQQETICECHSSSKTGEVELISELSEEAYIDVFCREEKGESYIKYEYNPNPMDKGRFYDLRYDGYGKKTILFQKSRRGYAPLRGRDCVKAVIYTEDVMRRYSLGRVQGYDNQEIFLPYRHIVAKSFCIIARREDKTVGYVYDFVRPEKKEDGALFYHLLENDAKIIIEDAGRFIGADLFLASVALTAGSDGNIREGNFLVSQGNIGGEGVTFYNPGPGTGGAFLEKLESVRNRFLYDMETPYTAVCEADYEKVVLSTPGLCLKKAKAEMDEERNLVKIAIMQGTDEQFPRLSPMYHRIIRERLEERRLLTTRVELVQPLYMAVNVQATVYVKLHYEDAALQIEEAIKRHIDYLNSQKNFGEVLKFDEVFHGIEMLECVEYVYELTLRPKSFVGAKLLDADILPDYNCLLYPGEIRVETITFEN